MIVNLPVRNNNTGMIHRGSVDSESLRVTNIYCGKPVGEQYEPVKGVLLTCAVCRTKLAGKIIGYKYSGRNHGRRRYR